MPNSDQGVTLRRLHATDADLAQIAELLNASDSEVNHTFTQASLREFLADTTRVYLLAYREAELVGASHGYLMLHPTGVKYFYIDEVDTFAGHRRQGVATAMMDELFKIAAEMGAEEAWLGADNGNDPAFALYEDLGPSEVEPGRIFTYKLPR